MIIVNIKASFTCDRKKLWEIVTNNKDYQWRSDLNKIEIQDTLNFTEYTHKNYPTFFTITYKEDQKRYEFDIKNDTIQGHWIGLFKETKGGCEIDFTEQIEVHNVIMRVFAKMYLKKQQRQYVRDLTKKVAQLQE